MLKNFAPQSGYYDADACQLSDLVALTEQNVAAADLPHASDVVHKVPVYDMAQLNGLLNSPENRRALMAEWAHVLARGAGVFVLQRAYARTDAIDAATGIYETIIAREKAASGSAADHFAAAGNNDRIWNALQKLCAAAPSVFIDYFANPAIAAACEAWLGPNYQMTAQINTVHPGGKSQQAHRDYHLGFQTAHVSASYPAHVHDLSPLMTLQGGIAHCDMPLASGPTKLLPFSQTYRAGYAAWRRADFQAHFEANCVQLPMNKGDALFFSPALFHAAGENTSTDVHRMVNLIQISSAFGRAMETIDRSRMCKRVYDVLGSKWHSGMLSEAELDAVIAATAEGYSFPTNLDRDPPEGGLAPQTQQELLKQALVSKLDATEFNAAIDAMDQRRQA